MPPLRALNRTTRVLLGTLLALALLVAFFDWNWFRGSVERYFSENSGREVRIGHFDLDLGFSLQPTAHMRDVHVENAPWASSRRPLIQARELSMTFSLKSVLESRPVISRLVLADAEVDLERQADGLRNWRLREPENRGRGRTRVLVLEAHRTQIRFVNRENDLELVAVATPAEAESQSGSRAEILTTRIAFEGRYKGAPYSGIFLNGGVVSFRESGVAFPLRGHLASGGARVEINGTFTDVFDIGPFDTAFHLTGPSLAKLHPFLPIKPPPSRPFDVRSQLTHRDGVYTFSQARAKVGETDISGEAVYDRGRERPTVRAEVTSASADLEDLRALAGLEPSARALPRRNAPELRTRPFDVEKLRAVDGHLKLTTKKLRDRGAAVFDSLRLEARLADGALEVKPLELGIYGGRVFGSVTFDARREQPATHVAVDLRELRLERLAPSIAEKARTTGPVRGRVDLRGQGATPAAMLASAQGTFAAQMDGGTLSSLTDAKLGLDFGKALKEFLRGDGQNAIHCGAVEFDVAGAVAKSKTIVLDTEQTHVRGSGTIDLRNERIDLLLTPQAKKPGLFTRNAAIRLKGSFDDVRTTLEDRANAPAATVSRGCER